MYRGRDPAYKEILDLPEKKDVSLHLARYWRPTGNAVQCTLCPYYCLLTDGKVGKCRVRVNRDHKLYSTVYGQPCTVAYAPVEQSPIFHATPGTRCLALATAGCNLRCLYCQNWQFSQVGAGQTKNYDLPPENVIPLARRMRCRGVMYTFTEPIVFVEYVADTAQKARKAGLKNFVVTAGYIDTAPLRDLCRLVDCVRIDLKAYADSFYQSVVGGRLSPVLNAIKVVKASPAFLEVVYLMLPGLNDDARTLDRMCRWMVENAGPDVPLHFLRFFSAYKLRNIPPTPAETLERARDIALKAGIRYAYVGNLPGHPGENTYCHKCGKTLIRRVSYLAVDEVQIRNGKCAYCGAAIPGVWG